MHYSSRKYHTLVEWIALNDEAMETDLKVIAESLTVTMISHCYNLKNIHVAEDVYNIRVSMYPK